MPDKDIIKSTKKSFEILDIIDRYDEVRVADIVDKVDISRTSVYKHLRTLIDIGVVENENGVFVLQSEERNKINTSKPTKSDQLQHHREIDGLAYSLDAPVNWWVMDNDECVCGYVSLPNEGRANPRKHHERSFLTESLPGRVILSSLSDSKQEKILQQSGSSMDVENIRKQIQSVRERTVLVDSITSEGVEWFSISTPVKRTVGEPNGSIEVVIPSKRARGIDIQVNIVGLLNDTKKTIETTPYE